MYLDKSGSLQLDYMLGSGWSVSFSQKRNAPDKSVGYIAGNVKDEPMLNYCEAHVFSVVVRKESAQGLFLCCVQLKPVNSDLRVGKPKKTPSRLGIQPRV